MESMLQSFKRYLEKSKSPHTARLYSRSVEDFLKWLSSRNLSIDKVTALSISEWQDSLLKRLDSRSVEAMSAALKTFFKASGRYDLAMAVPSVRYQAKLISWREEDVIKKIIEAGETLLKQAILAVGYELALRIGEVPLLQRSWYSPVERVCMVRRLKRKGAMPVYDYLPLRPYYAEKLEAYLEARRDQHPAMFTTFGTYGVGDARPIAVSTVRKILARASRKVGGEALNLSWHAFARHSRLTNYAIDMLKSQGQVDLFRVMKLAGHVSEKSTLVYIHLATSWFYTHQPASSRNIEEAERR